MWCVTEAQLFCEPLSTLQEAFHGLAAFRLPRVYYCTASRALGADAADQSLNCLRIRRTKVEGVEQRAISRFWRDRGGKRRSVHARRCFSFPLPAKDFHFMTTIRNKSNGRVLLLFEGLLTIGFRRRQSIPINRFGCFESPR